MSKFPEDWKKNSLGDLAIVVGGGTPSRLDPDCWNGSIPWVTPTEITKLQSKFICRTKERITEYGLINSSAKLHPAGTILMTSRASIGFCGINTVPMCTNQGFQSLKPKKEKVDTFFLYYLINNNRNELELLSSGSTFQEISPTNLRSITFTIPLLQEQKKIAEILISVDKVIELTEIEIEKLKNLKKGMMQDLLTKGIGHTKFKDSPIGKIPESWDNSIVSDVIDKNIYGPRFNANDYNESGNVKTIRGTDVDRDGNLKYLNAPVALLDEKLVSTHNLEHLDVIVVTTADCGVTSVFERQNLRYIPSAYMVKLRFNLGKMNPYFFKYLMGIDLLKNQVEASIRKGTVANLPGSDLTRFKVPKPPIEEQNEIVKRLRCADTNIFLKESKLQKLMDMKKGLMQDLLTGKVRVKV